MISPEKVGAAALLTIVCLEAQISASTAVIRRGEWKATTKETPGVADLKPKRQRARAAAAGDPTRVKITLEVRPNTGGNTTGLAVIKNSMEQSLPRGDGTALLTIEGAGGLMVRGSWGQRTRIHVDFASHNVKADQRLSYTFEDLLANDQGPSIWVGHEQAESVPLWMQSGVLISDTRVQMRPFVRFVPQLTARLQLIWRAQPSGSVADVRKAAGSVFASIGSAAGTRIATEAERAMRLLASSPLEKRGRLSWRGEGRRLMVRNQRFLYEFPSLIGRRHKLVSKSFTVWSVVNLL